MPWISNLFRDAALDDAPLGPFRNRSLSQMTLPGTHDSGCYRDQRRWNVFSATQTQDIGQQLAGGIRYFDLRPCANGLEFWTYHGAAYWGGQLTGADGILVQIRDFFDGLAPIDRELVILNISHFYKFTDVTHDYFIARIRAALGNHLVPYTQNNINIFSCPYWQLLSDPANGGVPPAVMAPATMRSRVLILYDGALDTAIDPYIANLPFAPSLAEPTGINGFFLLAPKYAVPANPIELFDQYSNRARLDDGVLLSGIRTDQLDKLRNRPRFNYSKQAFNTGPWSANAIGGVPGTLHLLSWTLTPQGSLSTTWDPLTAAREIANPRLLNLFCGANRGWAGVAYSSAADPQINILYVDDYASATHQHVQSPWHGMAMPVAIAARMNVGPVGEGNSW